MLYVTTMVIWGGGYAYQNYTRFDVDRSIGLQSALTRVNPNALKEESRLEVARGYRSQLPAEYWQHRASRG